ncbi:hypothetical protein Q0Z83_055010 [Actinoplanes sichuanensis]|uniref:DUF6114 domain-containing protein n=1 Tax=Actinoplanes sichuanensis TaxID=512349 RepID=A0ABW4ASA5_9ACTN|nr:DUF6114 domain-containing protein [Actinoplanes sichuanensis]BEL07310.1 hypothetical protein Q0Z83_055010 [Actinoplanes sichuanensis]
MATEDIRDRFRQWRRGRPYWGGLFLVLSGLEMFGSANMELDNIQIHIGPQGFYSYLLPVMMITAGVLTWVSPGQRLFYGVIGIITALYSFIGLNLGGWIIGMMTGIIGGALVIAWGPPGAKPATEERPTQEIDPVVDQPPAGTHRKALLIVAPLLLATSVMVAGNRPAEAADCPEGLPSRKASPSASASAAAVAKKPKPAVSKTKTAAPATSASPSPSASAAPAETGSGNPVLDGINDFWNGVGDFLGIGGTEEEAEPAPSASAEPSAAPSATTASPTPAPSATSATPSPSASTSASARPEEIPCLGARQMNVLADDGGIPLAGAKPGVVKAASITMYNSSYDGVADVPTGNGVIKALKFTMDKVVNKPFSLTIDEPGDAVTVIESGELILDGNVEFYSPTFKGKLFGLIPVTFTPEQPPPLTLPVLWFTDVTLDLAYVSSDVLTAKPLDIEETRVG